MGVQYLMTYMSSNDSKLKDYQLRKTHLIIDSNNLAMKLLQESEVPDLYGGNYMDYSQIVNEFIDLLIKCEISPIFVFDGCKQKNDNKFNKSLTSFTKYIKICQDINENKFDKLDPSLIYYTFLSVLRNRKIEYRTADFEADKEIAKLANSFKCPVLSNDSDFFIFPLEYGFVPFQHLNWKKADQSNCNCCTKQHHYSLSCKIFNCNNLILNNGDIFNSKLLPLFACLCGNDQTEKPLRWKLFHGLQKKRSNKLEECDISFNWLSQFNNEQDALNEVVRICEKDEKVREIIINSNKQYNLTEQNPNVSIINDLPLYIKKRFNEHLLEFSYLNVFICGNSLLNVSVENISRPLVHKIADKYRYQCYEYFVKFFKGFKNFSEYRRDGNWYNKIEIDRLFLHKYHLSEFYSTKSKESFLKLFLSEYLKSNNDNNANKSVSFYLLVCVLFEYCRTTNRFNDSVKQLEFYQELINCYVEPVIQNDFHIDIVHDFNELQVIYVAIFNLLMLNPSDEVVEHIIFPEYLFNGSMVYNACRNFQIQCVSDDDIVRKMRRLLSDDSLRDIWDIFKDFIV